MPSNNCLNDMNVTLGKDVIFYPILCDVLSSTQKQVMHGVNNRQTNRVKIRKLHKHTISNS